MCFQSIEYVMKMLLEKTYRDVNYIFNKYDELLNKASRTIMDSQFVLLLLLIRCKTLL